MREREAELKRMLRDLVIGGAVANACSALAAELSLEHPEQGDWILGLDGCDVPRGTLRSRLNVPRGTSHEKLNVPRGTLDIKPALAARKGTFYGSAPYSI